MFNDRRYLAVLMLVCVSFALTGCQQTERAEAQSNKTAANPQNSPDKKDAPKNQESVLISAVGDIMLGSTFPNETRMPPNDGVGMLDAATPILSKADIAFGNLEGPMVDSGASGKCGASKGNCFAFRVPTRYGKYLKDAGFDVLSLANNHAADFGDNGRVSSRKVLDELGIKHAGSDSSKFSTVVVESKGKKFAFIGFATNSVSLNVNDLPAAKRAVEAADKIADIVVVSFHGGAEGSSQTHVPNRTEMFFGEARGNLPLFSRTVIDAGADLILGHGPHVLRGMEIYKDRLVVYSMGNFATYGWFQLMGATAETLILDVEIAADGKFVKGKINPFKLEGRGIPVVDKSNSAIATLRSLSNADFAATAPKINDDGTFQAK